MWKRTPVLLIKSDNTLLHFTQSTFFLEFPSLNFNLYDILLAFQCYEVLRLSLLFKNIMQVVTTFLRGVYIKTINRIIYWPEQLCSLAIGFRQLYFHSISDENNCTHSTLVYLRKRCSRIGLDSLRTV